MSKKFKGKTCAYCGQVGVSTTGDHVIARGFLLERQRANLPQVPACERCNGEKSKLEFYLAQSLPLAATHAEAEETSAVLMGRKARHPANKTLREIISGPRQIAYLRNGQGQYQARLTFSVDAQTLHDWCGFVARGLAFYHWGVTTPNYSVETVPLAAQGESEILTFAQRCRGGEYVERNIGNGAFLYRGFKCADGEPASMWLLVSTGAC